MRLTVFLCFLAALCEGIDLQAAGVAAAGIRQQFHPDSQMLAYFFSASTLGLFFGAIIGGGWRYASAATGSGVSIAIFGLFSLFTPLSWDVRSLIAVRLLTGLGLGGALPNLVSIGSESAPAHRRSASVTMIYAGTPLWRSHCESGSLLTSTANWAWIFYIGGLVPLLVATGIALGLHESIAFTHNNPSGSAEHPLNSNGIDIGGGPGMAHGSAVGELPARPADTYLLLNWLPTLLANSGLSKTRVAVAMIGFNLGGCLSSLLIGFHLETPLRHRGVLVTFVGLPLLLLLLAVLVRNATPMVLTVCALGAAVVAAQAILYAFAPLCYPTRIEEPAWICGGHGTNRFYHRSPPWWATGGFGAFCGPGAGRSPSYYCHGRPLRDRAR